MRKPTLFIIVLLVFIAFFRLGSVTLFDVDEAVFSEATKEMVESANWITPTYNGENRYDKPILIYWLMAGAYKLFGINEFAARFPSAIAGVLLGLSLFLFVRRLIDKRRAFYSVTALALSLCFLFYTHAAVTDMTLSLFITLSIFSFYLSGVRAADANSSQSPYRWWKDIYVYGFYLFSALAFLTKGLVGILFPFGVAFLYMLITEGPGKLIRNPFIRTLPGGILLFLLISAPWYIAQLIINGQEFIQQFIIKHHFQRYAGEISGHREPFYYFLPVLMIGLYPWIAFLPAGIRNALKEKRPVEVFSLIWFAFVFIFFSFSTTKLPNYILPAVPPLTILIGAGITLNEKGWWGRLSKGLLLTLSMVLAAGFIISKRYLAEFGVRDLNWLYHLSGFTFMIALLSILPKSLVRFKPPAKRFSGLHDSLFLRVSLISLCILGFLVIFSIKAVPIVSGQLQGALHKYSLYAKSRLKGGGRLAVYRINKPSILFYSGHRVIKAEGRDALMHVVSEGSSLLAIAKVVDLEILMDAGFQLVEKDEKYAILERE